MSPALAGALVVAGFAIPAVLAATMPRLWVHRSLAVVGAVGASTLAGAASTSTEAGFAFDAWRGLLIVALAVAVAATSWLEDRPAPLSGLEASGVALAILGAHALVVVAGLAIASVAAVAEAWLAGPPTRNAIPPARVRAALLVASDLLLATAVILGADLGLLGLPRFDGLAGVVLAIALVVRLGAATIARAQPEAPLAAPFLAGMPVIVLAGWFAPGSTSGRATAVLAAGVAASAAWRLSRVGDARLAVGPWLALGVVAITFGAPATLTAAVGFVGAAALVVFLAAIAPGAALLVSVFPGGLALPSVLTLLEATAGAGVERGDALLVGALVGAGVLWLVVGAVAGVRAPLIPASLETRVGAIIALGGLAIVIGVGAPNLFADAGRDAALALGVAASLPFARAPFDDVVLALGLVALVGTIVAGRGFPWSTVWAARGAPTVAADEAPGRHVVRAARTAAGLGIILVATIVLRSLQNGWL